MKLIYCGHVLCRQLPNKTFAQMMLGRRQKVLWHHSNQPIRQALLKKLMNKEPQNEQAIQCFTDIFCCHLNCLFAYLLYIFREICATPIFHIAVRRDAEWVTPDHVPMYTVKQKLSFLFSQQLCKSTFYF